MTDRIEGMWAALPTPLAADGGLDHPTFLRHAQRMLHEGCDGLVPFGTTGEGTSFSAAERLAAVEALLAAGIAPDQLALGAGCPAIPDTVALAKGALALGLRHVLVLPPYFYRDADEQGIADAFAAIIEGVGDSRLRMTLYNIPQVSGIAVPPAALADLRARYGALVPGLKDSSGDVSQFEAYRAAAPEAAVTVGSEVHIGQALAAGGAGTICGMVNLVPALVRAMFTDPDGAVPMAQACALMQAPHGPTLKSILAAQTGEPGWSRVRPPLRAADPAVGQRIAAAMAQIGVKAEALQPVA